MLVRLPDVFPNRCNTCGEYIYKGKKFNSRKETVEDEDYLGLYIFRFYIKCPRCVAEIAFKVCMTLHSFYFSVNGNVTHCPRTGTVVEALLLSHVYCYASLLGNILFNM